MSCLLSVEMTQLNDSDTDNDNSAAELSVSTAVNCLVSSGFWLRGGAENQRSAYSGASALIEIQKVTNRLHSNNGEQAKAKLTHTYRLKSKTTK